MPTRILTLYWKGPKQVKKRNIKVGNAEVWFYTTGKTVEFYVRPLDQNGNNSAPTVAFRVRRESTWPNLSRS